MNRTIFVGLLLATLGCGQTLAQLSPFPCANDKTCPDGYFCGSNGCNPTQLCSAETPCQGGGFCSSGTCVSNLTCSVSDSNACHSTPSQGRCAWAYTQTGNGGSGVAEGSLQCIPQTAGLSDGALCQINSVIGSDPCAEGSVCAAIKSSGTDGMCKRLCSIGNTTCQGSGSNPATCAKQVPAGITTPLSINTLTGACTTACTPMAQAESCPSAMHCGITYAGNNNYYSDCQSSGAQNEGDNCATAPCMSDSETHLACANLPTGGPTICLRLCDPTITNPNTQCPNATYNTCTPTGNLPHTGYCAVGG